MTADVTGVAGSDRGPSRRPPGLVVAALSGIRQNAAVALSVDGELVAFCEQERITRLRREGLARGQLPLEALDAALSIAGDLPRSLVRRFVAAEPGLELPPPLPVLHVDHHHAHAATAFYLSPFDRAAVFICDHHSPVQTSVWVGGPDDLVRADWPGTGQGFASLYSECATLFGFAPGSEHQLEALARLDGAGEARQLDDVIGYADGSIRVSPEWKPRIADWLAGAPPDSVRERARAASAFQRHLGALLQLALADVRRLTGLRRLTLGGGLFYNTWMATHARQSGLFDDVFIAPNPGNAGVAAGAALLGANGRRRRPGRVSPFLGPEYSAEEIKRTLDNCKLSYEVLDEGRLVESTVEALVRGELVGWFQGRMEWGHRALGNRSILASPLSPYVLDNLNVYLKHRERHRTYGVSIPVERTAEFFSGPPESWYMEYEYAPVNPARFAALLPEGAHSLRLQTVPTVPDPGASQLFRTLLERFGAATGVPVLVNTSFNAFREPMVCSPRDAVRVFFGSGLDRLVLGRFVIRK